MTSLLPDSTHTWNSSQPTCRCGCPRASHEHYRRGTDCGLCGRSRCPSYRDSRQPSLIERLLRSLRVRVA